MKFETHPPLCQSNLRKRILWLSLAQFCRWATFMLISTTINSYKPHYWLGYCLGPMSVLITKSTYTGSLKPRLVKQKTAWRTKNFKFKIGENRNNLEFGVMRVFARRIIQCKCLERVVGCHVRLVWECRPRLGKAYFHHHSELGEGAGRFYWKYWQESPGKKYIFTTELSNSTWSWN